MMRVGKKKFVVVPPMSSRYQTWKFQVSPVCAAVLVGRMRLIFRPISRIARLLGTILTLCKPRRSPAVSICNPALKQPLSP